MDVRDEAPHAPGWPGIPARWTSSAKSGVGTALGAASRVWFTLSHGILNEIYYPRVDSACTRDLGLIVTDGASYFSEEKRHAHSEVSLLAPGVPAFHLRNTALDGRYRIDKDVLTDPVDATSSLQRVRFVAAGRDRRRTIALYALLAPHLNNHGAGNTAWVGDYKGVPMLFAERDGYALALACSAPWLARSVGFVGSSDGWQQLRAHGRLVTTYERAENGNVAMTGEIDLAASSGEFVLALGFGATPAEAGQHAVSSLITGFDAIEADVHRGAGSSGTARGTRPVARPIRRRARSSISARRCCACTSRSPSAAASSPASRFRGDSTKATTISAAITWSGLAIWSKRPAAFSRPARTTTRDACCASCR